MNTSLTAYTHLESLLLFQSLHAYGLGPQVFSRISDLLKTNPDITSDTRFQSGRLSPDALRNFYLHILKEELRDERDQADGDTTNGEVKASRKRKAPSPTLPTVQESVQHQHLIPKLVNKLYARYRAAITDQIRQEEDRYERLQRELQAIERGEWDDYIKERANGNAASRSPSLPKRSPSLSQQPFPVSSKTAPDRANGPPALGPVSGGPFHPNLAPALNGQVPEKSGPSLSPRKKQPSVEKKGKQTTPQPQSTPGVSSQRSETPRSLGSQPAPQGHPSTNVPYTGPPLPDQRSHPHSHSSTPGPRDIPTPGGQHAPYQGFPQHIQPYAANGVPQLAPSPGPQPLQHSPTHQRFSGPIQQNPQSPMVHTPQQQRGYVPVAGQPPYLPQHPQPGQPPPQGGFMLPPFQVAPQDPSRSQQQAAHMAPQHQVSTPVSGRQSSTKNTPYTGRSGVAPMQSLQGQASNSATPISVREIMNALSTPRTQSPATPKTAWKPSARNSGTMPASRPEVSPIDDIEPSRDRRQSPSKAKSTRKSRGKLKQKQKEQEQDHDTQAESDHQPEEAVPEMETRQGRSRRKAPIKKGRPGSIASSHAGTSVRGRSRSHSILSHTETIAADTESQTGSRIKSEDIAEDELAATPSQMSTRGRSAAKPNNKRKRNLRELTPEDSEGRSGTPGLPKTVVAPRHFSRMCAPLMNDIGSHKHASTFTTAVKAKDAEGYYDIIKQPTDIRTIQKAITAGGKQVAAAASGDTPAGSPGGAGGIVELPLNADNIPPKAIVNSAQLEKELMRMFVNAVMFNPGEEGVVEDAREMFESVQRSVSSWRSVEPSNGRLEVEETPPVVEEDVPVTAKRRKL